MKSGAYMFLMCSFTICRALAQGPPQQDVPEMTSHQAPATFTSQVNLISVPVVVRDSKGHAIGNLRREDFQLFDRGKIQVITKFSIETGGSADAMAREGTLVEGAASTESPKSVLPGRYVAYFFDDVHTNSEDLLQARQAANLQLDSSLDADTRVGIFTTSGRTTQDFTSDAEKLHAALNRIQPWERGLDNHDCPNISYYLADLLINKEQSLSPGLSDNAILGLIASDQTLNAVMQEAEACLHSSNLLYVLSEVRAAAQRALSFGNTESMTGLNTLRDLIGRMSTMPGSRRLVMVSPGFLLEDGHAADNTLNVFRPVMDSVFGKDRAR